jgi:SpoVK/Ycf46/Vps4 family AAA+-type ATPase
MRVFRQLQPDTEVIVIMEDIEASFSRNRTQILNLLDGIDSFEKVAYLATTNYPELLEPRIKNRPSRFDKRFNIGLPKAKARQQFIEFLLKKSERLSDLDVNQWVTDTEDMSFAHIKELFISVNLFGRPYGDTLGTLRDMAKNISSENFGDNGGAGFRMRPVR